MPSAYRPKFGPNQHRHCLTCGSLVPPGSHGAVKYCREECRPSFNHPKPVKPLAPCGTRAAYERHKKLGEEACQPCVDAQYAARRARDGCVAVYAKVAACGTMTGYFRHRRTTKTPPCRPCLDAFADYQRERVGARPVECVCTTCGKLFIGKTSRQCYCSDECRPVRRLKSGRPWERLRLIVIAEEDDCALCGEPVD